MTRAQRSLIVSAAILGAVAVAAFAGPPRPVSAAADQFCSGQNLAEGANWSVCW